jgi:RNA polymerase-binding protein DksA
MIRRSNLTPAELQEFKSMLLMKKAEIVSDVMNMEVEALRKERTDLSNMPIHMADLGTDNYDQEFTLGLMGSERELIMEIEEALGRIEDDTYGICQGDGEPIPKARLRAIPWAKYCVEHANLREKGLMKRRRIL